MHAHADMVESLLRTGAPVDNKMMVEAACHKLHEAHQESTESQAVVYAFGTGDLAAGIPMHSTIGKLPHQLRRPSLRLV